MERHDAPLYGKLRRLPMFHDSTLDIIYPRGKEWYPTRVLWNKYTYSTPRYICRYYTTIPKIMGWYLGYKVKPELCLLFIRNADNLRTTETHNLSFLIRLINDITGTLIS